MLEYTAKLAAFAGKERLDKMSIVDITGNFIGWWELSLSRYTAC